MSNTAINPLENIFARTEFDRDQDEEILRQTLGLNETLPVDLRIHSIEKLLPWNPIRKLYETSGLINTKKLLILDQINSLRLKDEQRTAGLYCPRTNTITLTYNSKLRLALHEFTHGNGIIDNKYFQNTESINILRALSLRLAEIALLSTEKRIYISEYQQRCSLLIPNTLELRDYIFKLNSANLDPHSLYLHLPHTTQRLLDETEAELISFFLAKEVGYKRFELNISQAANNSFTVEGFIRDWYKEVLKANGFGLQSDQDIDARIRNTQSLFSPNIVES